MRLIFFFFLFLNTVNAQDINSRQAYQSYSNRVVQVRVVEKSSRGKAGIGSGFYVDDNGLLVSNYHVVSSFVNSPEQFRLDIIESDGKQSEVELLYIDVVHDLALLKVNKKSESYFSSFNTSIGYGEKIFSIGNPRDLGFTIVEGIYNGAVKNSRLEKLNFSGSLNPGMSGGAAFDSNGQLVGVNVSTAGNQLSFLVPAKYVVKMLENYKINPNAVSDIDSDFIKLASSQVYQDQEEKFSSLLETDEFEKIKLENFSVPGKFINSLKCWSDSESKKDQHYRYLNYSCSTSELIYLDKDIKVGNLYLYYLLVTNEGLNSFSFSSKIQQILSTYRSGLRGKKEDFEKFKCEKDFVSLNSSSNATADSKYWLNLCTRKYKKLENLYDMVLIGASVDSSEQSLIFYNSASAISSQNIKAFSKKFLKNIVSNTSDQDAKSEGAN